jgi:hypothetical protein
MTDTDIANAPEKQKGEEDEGENESEVGQSSECVSHSMTIQCSDSTKLRGSEGDGCCDITATGIICTAERRSLNSSQKQATIIHCFLK